jgi:hypothetical protein
MRHNRNRSNEFIAGVHAILDNVDETGRWGTSPSTAELEYWGPDFRRGWDAAKRMSDAEHERYRHTAYLLGPVQ